MIRNTYTSYGKLAKFLHWLMAFLFVGMFIVAYLMINIKYSFRFTLYDLHKATGLLLFALVALRLMWRLINPQPTLPSSIPRWQHLSAKFNITMLYLLMFLMPISGILTSTLGGHPITFYHLFTIPPLANNKTASLFYSQAHEWLSYLLLFTFGAHLLATLYHHFILRDDIFKRMWIRFYRSLP